MRVQFGDITLDSASRQLVRGGAAIHLSPKAFDLLCHLVERRPSAVSKNQLFELVWPGTFVVEANLTVLVTELRRALGDDPHTPRFIRTVHKHGYAFCGEVTEIAPRPAGARCATRVVAVERPRVAARRGRERDRPRSRHVASGWISQACRAVTRAWWSPMSAPKSRIWEARTGRSSARSRSPGRINCATRT